MQKINLNYFILLLFILTVHSIGNAQSNKNRAVDSLEKCLKNEKDDSNKVNTMEVISAKFELMGKYDSSLFYSNNSIAIAEKLGYKKGLAVALREIGVVYFEQGNYSKALEYWFKALGISQEIGNKKIMASVYSNIGNVYYTQADLSKALEYYNKALGIAQEVGDKSGIAIHLGNIGLVYYRQGNPPKALEYFFKALSITQEIGDKDGTAFNLGYIADVYSTQGNNAKTLEYNLKALAINQDIGNKLGTGIDLGNIGSAYSDEGNYSKALEYFLKSFNIMQELGDKDVMAVNLNNIGHMYQALGNYKESIEYFLKSFSIAHEVGDKILIADVYTGLGETYIKQKDYKHAKIFLDSALALSQTAESKKNAYAATSVLDSATGNYKSSFDDYKKYIVFRDSIINKESVKKTTQLEVSYEFQKREDSIKVVQEKADILGKAKSNRKTIITWSAVLILILVIVLGILFINRQQIKHRKDQIISEKEKNLLKLEKQRMEDELKNASALLDEYIKNVVQKNTLLEEFKSEIEELKKLKSKEIDENRIEHLEQLSKQTILTEDDWNKFKELFEQVHKGYFIRMREKLPDITQAEMRLVCLTKLKLGTKEMAGILGVSFDTIRKSRYRLRKKLNLPEEDTIDVIAESI